jgi:hypothetical protein
MGDAHGGERLNLSDMSDEELKSFAVESYESAQFTRAAASYHVLLERFSGEGGADASVLDSVESMYGMCLILLGDGSRGFAHVSEAIGRTLNRLKHQDEVDEEKILLLLNAILLQPNTGDTNLVDKCLELVDELLKSRPEVAERFPDLIVMRYCIRARETEFHGLLSEYEFADFRKYVDERGDELSPGAKILSWNTLARRAETLFDYQVALDYQALVLEAVITARGAQSPEGILANANFAHLLSLVGRKTESAQLLRSVIDSLSDAQERGSFLELCALESVARCASEVLTLGDVLIVQGQIFEDSFLALPTVHDVTLRTLSSTAEIMDALDRSKTASNLRQWAKLAQDEKSRARYSEWEQVLVEDGHTMADFVSRTGRAIVKRWRNAGDNVN